MTKIELLIQRLTIARLNAGGVPSVRDTTLLESFKAQSTGKGHDGGSPCGIPNPFRPLPNVKASWIKTNKVDPLLAQFSIVNKFNPEIRFDSLSRKLTASNRYLRIMHFRLVKFLVNGDINGFWRFCLCYMNKSSVLRLVALRKLDHNWHANIKLGTAKGLLFKLAAKIDTLDNSISIVRTYVTKMLPDGQKSYRPIGNPAYHDRMFLYLWQSFFSVFLYHFISKSQHAYRRGFGTLTAWQELKSKIHDYPFIWEYDLKGAFPSTSIDYVFDRLHELGLPGEIADFLQDMSLNVVPELDRSQQLLDEPKIDAQEHLLSTYSSTSVTEAERIQFLTDPESMDLDIYNTDDDDWPTEGLDDNPTPITHDGLPEGSGLSPILFAFAFEDALVRGHFGAKYPFAQILAYADDFLLLSKETISNFIESSSALGAAGFKFATNKCRSLRDDSGWLVEKWKFLGITHFTKRDVLVGTPRSGKDLLFDKVNAVDLFSKRERSLWWLTKSFPALGSSPQAILDSWGRGELPASLLPETFIDGSQSLGFRSLKAIKSLYQEHLADPSGPLDLAKAAVPSAGYSKSKSSASSGSMGWLTSRLGGTLMSRLYDGQWHRVSDITPVSFLPESPERTKGRSWVELYGSSAIAKDAISLDLHNSTSFAAMDMLMILKDPSSVKIKANSLLHRYSSKTAVCFHPFVLQLAANTSVPAKEIIETWLSEDRYYNYPPGTTHKWMVRRYAATYTSLSVQKFD